jgi:hypothetical protein
MEGIPAFLTMWFYIHYPNTHLSGQGEALVNDIIMHPSRENPAVGGGFRVLGDVDSKILFRIAAGD